MNERSLVLLHGYPFDHTLWELVIPRLAAEVRVLAPDLPGFGTNPPGDDAPSLEAMADDVLEWMDQAGCEKAVMAGMSMGGYVALAFAERHADRLAGLALISSQTVADTEEGRKARRSMIEKVQKEGIAAATSAALPKLFASEPSTRPDLVRYALQGAERAGITGITRALEAMARRPDRTHILGGLKVPLLILHGSKDKFIPSARAKALAAQFPNATYERLPGVGHCLPIEAPRDTAEILLEFVEVCQEESAGA